MSGTDIAIDWVESEGDEFVHLHAEVCVAGQNMTFEAWKIYTDKDGSISIDEPGTLGDVMFEQACDYQGGYPDLTIINGGKYFVFALPTVK